jgi:hypothetical protein
MTKNYEDITCPCCYAAYLDSVPEFKTDQWTDIGTSTVGKCPVCGIDLSHRKDVKSPWGGNFFLFPLVRADGSISVYGDSNGIKVYFATLAGKTVDREFTWDDLEKVYDHPKIYLPWHPCSMLKVIHDNSEIAHCECGKVKIVKTVIHHEGKFIEGSSRKACYVVAECPCGKHWENGQITGRKCPKCGAEVIQHGPNRICCPRR